MKINLSGHHVEISDHIRQHVSEKFSKIAKHFPALPALDIIIAKEQSGFQVEISSNYEGARVSASDSETMMEPAILNAARKFEAALQHRKGQVKSNF